jgi:hypothetical protein
MPRSVESALRLEKRRSPLLESYAVNREKRGGVNRYLVEGRDSIKAKIFEFHNLAGPIPLERSLKFSVFCDDAC